MKRYVIPESVTFWIGVLMMVSGVLEFVDFFVPLGWLGYILTAAYGNMSPFMLILTGSGTVTMRAAIKWN
jgi:hypothetical protein